MPRPRVPVPIPSAPYAERFACASFTSLSQLRPGGINLLEKQEQERQAYATWLTEQDAAAAAELEAAATRLQSLQRGRLGRRHRAEGTPKDDN